jgi:hypothetical protein
MSDGEDERQQDINYILHVAGEFNDEYSEYYDIYKNYLTYDEFDTTNAILIPQVNISPKKTITKGIEEFISYVHALSGLTTEDYTIFCPRDLMEKFFTTVLYRPPTNTTLGSLWSFKITVYEDEQSIDVLDETSSATPVVVESVVPQAVATIPYDTSLYSQSSATPALEQSKVPRAKAVESIGVKTFSFICDAYSIQDYMNTKEIPRSLQDESLTLWGIFTSLLRGNLLAYYLTPIVSDNFLYVSEKVTSWMTFICLYIPALDSYSPRRTIYIKVSYLLNSGNHDRITLEDKKKKNRIFF